MLEGKERGRGEGRDGVSEKWREGVGDGGRDGGGRDGGNMLSTIYIAAGFFF